MSHVQHAPERPKPWRDRLTAALFLAALVAAPAFALWNGPSVSPFEFRAPAPWPAAGVAPQDYPPKVEAWAADHIGGRAALIEGHMAWKRDLLGLTPARRVALGRDGWLFMDIGDVNPYYRPANRRPDLDKQLDAWAAAFADRRDWLAAQGVPYVVFVAPNKHTIYPEMLAPEKRYLADESMIDPLSERLAAMGIPFVDPRPELIAAKADARAYMRQDTHWNVRGAWVAYQPLRRELARIAPAFNVRELPAPEFVVPVDPEARYVCDLARQIGLTTPGPAEEYPQMKLDGPRPVAKPMPWAESSHFMDDHPVYYDAGGDASLPRVFYFCDSFIEAMRSFIGVDCREQLLLPCHDLGTDSVYYGRPDVVVQEMVENTLTQPPHHRPGVKDFRLQPLAAAAPPISEKVILEGESGPFRFTRAVKDDAPEFVWTEPTPKYKAGQATFLRVSLGRAVGGGVEAEFTTNAPTRQRTTIRQHFTGGECWLSLSDAVPGEPVKVRLLLAAEPGAISSAWHAVVRPGN